MVLQRWDPFTELRRMDDVMNRLWRGFSGTDGETRPADGWAIPLDVAVHGDRVEVSASMPGLKPEDIHVTVDNGVLTIRGELNAQDERESNNYLIRERRTGTFYRAIRLPEHVDHEKAESTYENGILTISFPKAESSRAKTIEVKAGKAKSR